MFDVSWVEDEDGFVAGFVYHPKCQFGLGSKSDVIVVLYYFPPETLK